MRKLSSRSVLFGRGALVGGVLTSRLRADLPGYEGVASTLPHILQQMAEAGAKFDAIAGNDAIMFTAL